MSFQKSAPDGTKAKEICQVFLLKISFFLIKKLFETKNSTFYSKVAILDVCVYNRITVKICVK